MLASFTADAVGPSGGSIVMAVGLVLAACAGLLHWLTNGPRTPDPWDAETIDAPGTEDLILCHRCLVPNNTTADFCENCGAAVGQYTNYLPFPHLFSIGHTLRLGTAGEFKRNKLTVCGFVLLALLQYSVFAPVYLLIFFSKALNSPTTQPEDTASAAGPQAPAA
jgi:hypothetical protein